MAHKTACMVIANNTLLNEIVENCVVFTGLRFFICVQTIYRDLKSANSNRTVHKIKARNTEREREKKI